MRPKLPIDFNSDSAFEKLKFIEEHYEELMLAYKNIMEHLRIPVLKGGGESPFDIVTATNPKPMYITLRFVDSLPPPSSDKVGCYFGSPKFDSSNDVVNDYVTSSYIQNLVGASYQYEIVPSDNYYYFLRVYRDGVEIDYGENSSLSYSYNDEDWEGLELHLFRLNRYQRDISEDLGDFASAVESLFTPAESELKPTSKEVLRGLSIMDENYLINETDTPYTYAIDCCKYTGQYLRLNGGTYSNIGTVGSSGRYSGFLGVESSCSVTSEEANHFYVNVLIDTNEFSLSTYKAEEDNTPFTFTRLVPKV